MAYNLFIAHQVWTGIPPKVRKLASHIILYPQRIAKDSVGHIARSGPVCGGDARQYAAMLGAQLAAHFGR